MSLVLASEQFNEIQKTVIWKPKTKAMEKVQKVPFPSNHCFRTPEKDTKTVVTNFKSFEDKLAYSKG